MSKAPKYPIFLECSEYTLDTYWIDILQSCALGKFPKRMSMADATTIKVMSENKKKHELFAIKDDPKEAFMLCMKIFKDILGMKSKRDQKAVVEEFENRANNEEHIQFETWDSIKPKSHRERFLNDYVIEMKKKHNLTYDGCSMLRKKIQTGLLFKQIKSEHIVFDNMKIHDITNLTYNEKTKSFDLKGTIDIKQAKTAQTTKANPNIKSMEKYIESHISDFREI